MRTRLLRSTIALGSLLLVSKSVGIAMVYLPLSWTLGRSFVPVASIASAAESSHIEAQAADHPEAVLAKPPASATIVKAASSIAPPSASPVSAEERDLLQSLRERRQQWDAKDRALAEQAEILSAAEQRLVARAAELTKLQARLEQLEKSRAEREDTNWLGLVKIYETMKPRDAASVFNDMDMPVLLQIVDRMKESKTAAIFGAMLPDRARLLTSQLAAKRSRTTTVADLVAPTADGNSHQQ